MTAAVLREAASLMRERATTAPVPAGPWESEFSDVIRTDVPFGNPGYLITECATLPEAKHIASWHPAVALAVADWLDATARELESLYDPPLDDHPLDGRRTAGLAVARAYLGTPP